MIPRKLFASAFENRNYYTLLPSFWENTFGG
jgi:hypothetical protein